MKFYSFSDLIRHTRIEERNNFWISRLTDEVSLKRGDARYFINYWKIPVSEDVWLLHHAMDKVEKWK